VEAARAAQQRDRERLRLIAEALRGYAYDWDLRTGLVDRAADFAAFLGFDNDEIPPDEHWWIERIHPQDLAGPIASTRALFGDPAVTQVSSEYRVRHRDGSWRRLSDHARLLRDENGHVTRMVGITVDVTEEREQQQREHEALLAAEAERRRHQEAQAVLAQASAALGQSLDVRSTAAAIALAALPRFADSAIVYGFDERGTLTQLAVAHDEEWVLNFDVDNAIHRVIRTREPLLVDQTAIAVPLNIDGETTGVLMLFTVESGRRYTAQDLPLALELGRRGAIALVNARLYELERRAHEEARAARADAEAANQSKSNFLAAMSHELRTPLNAIAGYTELLDLGIHGPVTDEQRKALNRIKHSERHLLSLINQVLNYARLEAGAVQYEITSVVVRDALAKAESFVLPLVRSKGLELRIEVCDPTLAVTADEAKLSQVLLNLLSNAVKFTEPKGLIGVSCRQREKSVDLVVADTGVGIAVDHLEHIFEPFVQIGRTLSSPHEGTGLGLAISRDLARGMGGELTAASIPGRGSTFTLTLPK
jgi:PAS domain S-box-containing protein